MLRALIHAHEILTGAGFRRKDGRKVQEADLEAIPDGALVFEEEKGIPRKIRWVGPTSKLPQQFSRVKKRDLKGKRSVTAGWIDCHTHLVFAGNRAGEFAQRCGGASYEEIAAAGGGILSTIRPTREASESQLLKLATPRVKEAYDYGVRTLEIKSGYGLELEAELRCLRVIQTLKKKFPQITFVSTFLGAHAFPPDVSREAYVDSIVEEMLPAVKKQKLATFCDVFVDRGYFTIEQARRILGAAQDLGLKLKIHGDELVNTESARFAAEIGALSVDHLLKVSEDGISALAESQTVAVVLPGTAFYLKAPHAPARKLIDAGAVVALATDFNPGSSMCNSLPAMMTIGGLYLGMTRSEILASVTYNAAKSLGLEKQKGTLQAGKDADFTITPFQTFEETYYRFAWSPSQASTR